MAPIPTISEITLATLFAYLLGAIPVAWLTARAKGVDIFKVGSGQAGSTNVWRHVGRLEAAVVFFTDSTKGLASMLVARAIGLHSEFLLVPAFATVLAHWKSPWTRFKGGDGVATLTGIGIGYAPHALAIPYFVVAAFTLGLNRRFAHPALWGAVVGYITFLVVSFAVPAVGMTPVETFGFTGLGVAILLHSVIYHKRHLGRPDEEEAGEGEAAARAADEPEAPPLRESRA
jgi:glycerol-3-phosphate acyltransferase PlsY